MRRGADAKAPLRAARVRVGPAAAQRLHREQQSRRVRSIPSRTGSARFVRAFSCLIIDVYVNVTPGAEMDIRGKVFIVACMRKLLVILNTMVKQNSPWRGMSPA